jgi:hypothetical protein
MRQNFGSSQRTEWREAMKKFFLIAVMLFALQISGLTTARAQVIDTVVADVPFGFTIDNVTLPAGEYEIKRVNSAYPSVMEISSKEGHRTVIFVVGSAQMNKEPRQTELIFDRVGDQYFLSKIFEAWDSNGVELPKSRSERRLQKEGASVELDSVVVPSRM